MSDLWETIKRKEKLLLKLLHINTSSERENSHHKSWSLYINQNENVRSVNGVKWTRTRIWHSSESWVYLTSLQASVIPPGNKFQANYGGQVLAIFPVLFFLRCFLPLSHTHVSLYVTWHINDHWTHCFWQALFLLPASKITNDKR